MRTIHSVPVSTRYPSRSSRRAPAVGGIRPRRDRIYVWRLFSLLGRGGRNHEHEGNEQLRRIAHSRVREYVRASKKQKAVISREIMRQIQRMEPPGRFLTKNYSTYEWDVVSQEKAREKVCQSLRDAVAVEREQLEDLSPSPALAPAAVKQEDEEVESLPSLPDAMDVLSSELLFEHHSEQSDASNDGGTHAPIPIVTPARKSNLLEEAEEVEAYHYRPGLCDDFDLFDGGLLRAQDDVVLRHL